MGKIKSILAALALCAVSVFWSFTTQAAGSFGVESISVLDKSIDVVAEAPTVSGNTINSTIVFHTLNDYVTYGLKIKNSTSTSYEILDITDDNANSLVEYSYDNHANEVIGAGESLDLELTISYVQAHLDDSDRTLNNNVKLTISYLDLHTGVVEEDEILLVPNTGANTIWGGFSKCSSGIMVFTIILLGVGIVAAVLYKKKRTVFILAFGIVFAATGLSYMNVTAEDYLDMDVTFNSEIRLRDYMYGEVYLKDPDTGDDLYLDPEEFGGPMPYAECKENEYWYCRYFGDIFDPEWWDAPRGLMITGFQFTGTDTEVDPEALILDDFNVTIIYGVPTFNITYDYDGGTVAEANPTSVTASDEPFTLHAPTKDGVFFGCWQESGMPAGQCQSEITINPSELTRDLHYKAIYEFEAVIYDQYGNELERGRAIDGIGLGSGYYYSVVFMNVSGYKVNSGSCTNGQRLRYMGSSTAPYPSYEVDSISASTVCTLNIITVPMEVSLNVIGGTGSGTLNVARGEDAIFENITANAGYMLADSVSCTNDQTATISGNKVTVSNVTKNTQCTVRNTQLSFYTMTEMQQMTPALCASATTPNVGATQYDTTGNYKNNKNYIPRRTLVDTRDNKTYQVTKLADGKCWMTQNLAIGNAEATMTLTPEDSDVLDTFTLPKSDITVFAGTVDINAVYVDDTFGGYYSSRTANADSVQAGDASICPKGWTLPTITYTSGDWTNLINKYNYDSVRSLYNEPINLTHSYYVKNGVIYRNNVFDTYYIGPTVNSAYSFSSLGVAINDNWTGTSRIESGEGGNVRCIAR